MSEEDSFEDVVADQIAYYEARALEYDDWWERRGRYDAGPEHRNAWARDAEELRCWLASLGDLGDVLEIAAGTGNWTRHVAPLARSVHAIDASPSSIEICKMKVGTDNMTVEIADVFRWRPTARYDCVFSAFWLSHIPPKLWAEHWAVVCACLRPGGRVLLIESAQPHYAAANGPQTWSRGAGYATPDEAAAGTRRQRIVNGVAHVVEKHYWTPEQLAADLAAVGWTGHFRNTGFAFLYGLAEPPCAGVRVI